MDYYKKITNIYVKFGVNYKKYFFKIIILSFIAVIVELLGISNLIVLISSISSPEYYDLIIDKISTYLIINKATAEYYLTINNLILFCLVFYVSRFFVSIFHEYLMHKYVGQIKICILNLLSGRIYYV